MDQYIQRTKEIQKKKKLKLPNLSFASFYITFTDFLQNVCYRNKL